MNKVVLIGRLAKNVELKYTPNDKAVASFTLAVSRERDKENADFLPCVVWGKQAEILQKYVFKGNKLAVEGKIQNKTWEKDGVRKYKTEIIVISFEFLEKKKDNNNQADEEVPF